MPSREDLRQRGITDEAYRYGYQGQFSEKDLTTGQQEFELRNYDPRIGRWLSPDPYGQFASPYLAMGNNPASNVDPDGGFTGGPGPGPLLKNIGAFKYAAAIEASFGSSVAFTVTGAAVTGAVASSMKFPKLLGSMAINMPGKMLSGGAMIEGITSDYIQPQRERTDYGFKYRRETYLSERYVPTNTTAELAPWSETNPWINVASSGNDIFDTGVAIANVQIAKSAYWSVGTKLATKWLGHAFGGLGVGFEAWSFYEEAHAEGLGPHSYLNLAVEVGFIGIGGMGVLAAGTAAPVLAVGSAVGGLGYGIYMTIDGNKRFDRFWKQEVVPLQKKLTMRIHRFHL
jgi:RHS repeat-associated protein